MNEKLKWLEQLANNEIDLDTVRKFLKDEKQEQGHDVVKQETSPTVNMKSGRMFRIKVDSADGDKVNIKVPLNLAKMVLALKPDIVKNKAFAEHGVDIHNILDLLDSDAIGDIVDIESADGDTVKIFVE